MNPEETSSRPLPSFDEDKAQEGLFALVDEVKTAILGTIDLKDSPEASYAPCIHDEAGSFYVYVSALAKHSANLRRTRKASLMLIEDEGTAANLHARRRATWNCSVEAVARDSEAFNARLASFREHFGKTMESLATMQDFTLFQLKPASGRLVLGFGAAFRLEGWQVLKPMQGRHRPARSS